MPTLKERLYKKIVPHRARTAELLKQHRDVVIDTVTIGQCIGGARDVKCLVTDISSLDPQEGIRFRGKTIGETFAQLPHVPGCEYPYVEGF
ncbi:MAG: citrate (Si)-synthase, partial [Deltaproteobacteria bacterium]|nr:citrate (Si)-synthase [Deltaproteobacteria bacterium]